MRSWSYFTWVKWLIPLIIIGGAFLGYNYYDKTSEEKRLQRDEQKALITAQVWVASAVYREEPEKFLAYRDSLLDAYNVSKEEMNGYLEAYGGRTERFNNFTWLVQEYVDSLSETGFWQDQLDTLTDSLPDK